MSQNVTCIYPSGHVSPPPENKIIFSWSATNQKWNQVKYKKKDSEDWIDLGTEQTSSNSRELNNVKNTLNLNSRYEWKVRVWDTSDNQSNWSPATAFVYREESVAVIGEEKIRVVNLGKSEKDSGVRVKLNKPLGIFELDLTEYAGECSSKIKLMSFDRKLSAAVEVSVHIPHENHADVGYTAHHTNRSIGTYRDHSDSGSTSYNNHSDNGGSKYANHNEEAGGNHTDFGTDEHQDIGSYPNHSDNSSQHVNSTTSHTDEGSDYINHSNNGSTSYNNHSDKSVSYNNHINQGSSKYSDHSDS